MWIGNTHKRKASTVAANLRKPNNGFFSSSLDNTMLNMNCSKGMIAKGTQQTMIHLNGKKCDLRDILMDY